MQRSCASCGQGYDAKRPSSKYCGDACRKRASYLRLANASDTPRPVKLTDALDATARDVLVAARLMLAKALEAGQVSSNALASTTTKMIDLDRAIRAIDDAARDEEKRSETRPRRSFRASAL